MDKIIMKKLQFYGYHGLLPEENTLGQRFHVDVELMMNLKPAGKSDRMEDSVHYGHVYEAIQEIVEGKPKKLIEALAEEIAEQLFFKFGLLQACLVKVVKPDPPIRGHYESVAVEIFREKNNE